MNGRDLTSMSAVVMFFRGGVEALAPYVEAEAVSPAAQLEIEAPCWERPTHGGQWRANARLVECGSPVVRRVLDGWQAPSLEAVAAVEVGNNREAENELGRLRLAFVRACAEVAAQYAAHGSPYLRRLDDGSSPRRVQPGTFPEQAAALLPAARETLTAYALFWMALAGRVEGATFLPRRAA